MGEQINNDICVNKNNYINIKINNSGWTYINMSVFVETEFNVGKDK